jgi:thioredoxin 1
MLGAAGIVALWTFFRGGSKMKASNALILIGVVAVVAGVAWFRSARAGADAHALAPGGPSVPANPAAESASNPAGQKKLPRVVDLGADKCIPCKQMAPILVELRKEYEGRVIVDFIDVWKNPNAGEPYKIRIIPTQIFFNAEGKEVWRHEGFLSKAEFVAKFAELGVK